MKLIYIDPECSGLQIAECKTGKKKEILEILNEQMINKENCADCIYYVFIDKTGKTTKGEIDFSC